jgi:hypothetical protein
MTMGSKSEWFQGQRHVRWEWERRRVVAREIEIGMGGPRITWILRSDSGKKGLTRKIKKKLLALEKQTPRFLI